MNLEELARNWNQFGIDDPLWAILTDPEKTGGRWDLEEFMSTGKNTVDVIVRSVRESWPKLGRGKALDFGCGVGRLTQALADHFDEVLGVDIAASMVERARSINRHADRCRYVVNAAADLSQFGDDEFDFILSLIALQHIDPGYTTGYLREMMRILRPGGVLVFQLPCIAPPPARGVALPDESYRAGISLDGPVPPCHAGSVVTLPVKVTNAGDAAWPGGRDAADLICLGSHLAAADGSPIRWDDERVRLPHEIAPGETVHMEVHQFLPSEPGEYQLEFDLVHEHVCWFAHRGSPVLRIPIVVLPPSEPVESAFAPRMEMYGLAPSAVLHLFDESGEVLRVERGAGTGPPWQSYFYWIRKRF